MKPQRIAARLIYALCLSGFLIVFTSCVKTYKSASSQIQAQALPTPHLYFPLIVRQPAPPPSPNSPPLSTTSFYFYMPAYNQAALDRAFNQGCNLGVRDMNLPGRQNSLVILDFGITQNQNGQYGASGMKIGGFYTLEQIGEVVFHFGKGYWTCTNTDYESHLTIGIGTNNYNNGSVYSHLSVTEGHGRAWGSMVNQVYDRILTECPRGCDGQVDIAGANDIELAWSAPQDALDWVNGYSSVAKYPLYNFGAAEGCPDFCGGGGYRWAKEQVWAVTNGGIIYSVPEIYLNNGANARQWYQLSLSYAQAHGVPYDFAGVMTQYGACQQYPETACEVTDNLPEEGWTQLYNLINGSNPTTWDSLPFVTDIQWSE